MDTRFSSRWPNSKSACAGFWLGRGRTSREVAAILGDGTSADTVRRMKFAWGLTSKEGGRHRSTVPVSLLARERHLLSVRARQAGLSPEEFLRRVCVCVLEDDMYAAVVDGRFDA